MKFMYMIPKDNVSCIDRNHKILKVIFFIPGFNDTGHHSI